MPKSYTTTLIPDDAILNREQLSDVIKVMNPTDTVIFTMLKKSKLEGQVWQWGKTKYRDPKKNAVGTGSRFEIEATKVPERVQNYTQIFRDSFSISRSQMQSGNAGNIEKVNRQRMMKGVEVRRDIEFALVSPQASKDSEPPELGGIPTWIETNVERNPSGGGANGGYNKTTKTTEAPTNGDKRDFTKELLDKVLVQCYQSGAKVKSAVVSPHNKQVFSTFMSDPNVAQLRYAAKGMKNPLLASADTYLSDFGEISIIPNTVMSTPETSRNIFLIDPTMMEMKVMQPLIEYDDLPHIGDSKEMAIIGEYTLEVTDESAHGIIADLNGMSA